MKFNRLEHFQKSPEKVSKYRAALAVLYQLGIDQMLADLSLAKDTIAENVSLLEANALQNQRTIGYKECIEDLFSLDKDIIPEEFKGSPDYGAVEKMIAEGRINAEDADELLKGI